jgi:Domain of unknown function (DUF4129)
MNRSLSATFALLVGALLALPAPARSGATSGPTAGSFDKALEHAADRLDAAAAAVRLNPKQHIASPSLELPRAPLDVPSSPGVSLDRWLAAQSQRIGREKSRAVRTRELTELAASLRRAATPGTAHVPAADPSATAMTITSQKVYQTGGAGPAPPPHESILERIIGWLGQRLGELIQRIFGVTASRPIIGQIVAALFIALVASLAAYLIYLLVMLFVRGRRRMSIDEGTPLQERADPDALHELGLAAANEGRYAQAVSLLFQASLAAFDRSGKLAYDGSLTAGEYRRAVRRAVNAAAPYFDDIARTFVLAAFAERPVSADDFAAADAAYRSLRPLVAA